MGLFNVSSEWKLGSRLSLVRYSHFAPAEPGVWGYSPGVVEPQLGVLLKYRVAPQTYSGLDFRQRHWLEPTQSKVASELRAVVGGSW